MDPTNVEEASVADMEEHSEDDAAESSDTEEEDYTENTSSIANESESPRYSDILLFVIC